MNAICIVMVAYNPGERTYNSINKLLSFDLTKMIIIVDNTPNGLNELDRYNHISRVVIIRNKKNLGIAKAQNIGLHYLMNKGEEWGLTLDQDTIIKKELLQKYIDYINDSNYLNIGIIATDYYDIGTCKRKFNNSVSIEVNETISSGSLINLTVYNKIGDMKNDYFIDQVDNEYCYRLIKAKYRIVVLPGIGMEHKLGNIYTRKFFGRKICIYNQSPIRVYYRTRNVIWFCKEYKDLSLIIQKSYALLTDLIRIFFENNRMQKYKMFIKGLVDGLIKRFPK